jgi:hypothetical protein
MRGKMIDMNDEQLKTFADLQGFLDGTVIMDFAVAGEDLYAFIARTVRLQSEPLFGSDSSGLGYECDCLQWQQHRLPAIDYR